MLPELILDVRADLGEGPAWDARGGLLYWVDIHAGHLHVYDPRAGTDRSVDLGEFVGCVAPRMAGGVVLGLQSGFATLESSFSLDPASSMKGKPLLNPEAHIQVNRFNDGKCDPNGRFLAGTMNDLEITPTGSLYSLFPDGTLKTLLTGIGTTNGLAWSPDYRTFYFIDTPTRKVTAFDYDLAAGEIANPRTAVAVPEQFGWPDGMTSDAEGMLWVAMWGGAKLTRWDPASGNLLESIPFPAPNVSSCAFGGPHLTELYVTTARTGLTVEELDRYPHSGGLFRLSTGVIGLPTFEFGG